MYNLISDLHQTYTNIVYAHVWAHSRVRINTRIPRRQLSLLDTHIRMHNGFRVATAVYMPIDSTHSTIKYMDWYDCYKILKLQWHTKPSGFIENIS